MHVKVESLHAGSKWTPSKTLCAKAPRKGLDNEGSAKASITTPYSYVLRDASLRPIQDSGFTVKNLLYVQKPCKQLGARNESFYEPPKVEVNRCDRFAFNTAKKLVSLTSQSVAHLHTYYIHLCGLQLLLVQPWAAGILPWKQQGCNKCDQFQHSSNPLVISPLLDTFWTRRPVQSTWRWRFKQKLHSFRGQSLQMSCYHRIRLECKTEP